MFRLWATCRPAALLAPFFSFVSFALEAPLSNQTDIPSVTLAEISNLTSSTSLQQYVRYSKFAWSLLSCCCSLSPAHLIAKPFIDPRSNSSSAPVRYSESHFGPFPAGPYTFTGSVIEDIQIKDADASWLISGTVGAYLHSVTHGGVTLQRDTRYEG